MNKSPFWPVTEGEVFRLAKVTSIPVTENPASGEIIIGASNQNTTFIQDSDGNALLHVTLVNGKTVAPGASDDNTKGFIVGSIWVNETAKIGYMCMDASTGAAIWKVITA